MKYIANANFKALILIIFVTLDIYNSVEATTATEGFEIASVPLLDILPKMSVVDGKYKDVDMMQIIGNLLLVQVQGEFKLLVPMCRSN